MGASRLTIVSREAKKKQAVRRTRQTSELFTGSTALKLVNALNKPPLVIKDSARSNYIEPVTQQWRKSAPLILKAGGHGHFHNTFLVPMFSLGDAET